MQHAFPTDAVALTLPRATATVALSRDEALRIRRLRSLLALFVLYAVALFAVMAVSDGGDVGCILAGIAGHVLFATSRLLHVWRDDCWLEDARTRLRLAPSRAPAQAH
jgi:hypothetical protein